MSQLIWSSADQAAFNPVYRASLAPAVAALLDMTPADRFSTAQALMLKGVAIDTPIMINGMDPYDAMFARLMGPIVLPWVPALGQPPLMFDGNGGPLMFGSIPYDPKNPPKGAAIMSSLNLSDYPAQPVVAAPQGQLVGAAVSEGMSLYFSTEAALAAFKAGTLVDGQVVTEDRGKFMFHVVLIRFMMGGSYTSYNFQKIS